MQSNGTIATIAIAPSTAATTTNIPCLTLCFRHKFFTCTILCHMSYVFCFQCKGITMHRSNRKSYIKCPTKPILEIIWKRTEK